jgi:Protein of unknown function (DUF3768)
MPGMMAMTPGGEHDFGAFEVDGQRVFFKFDYYNRDMKYTHLIRPIRA